MKSRYIALSESEPSIPLFSRPWWLDAMAGEDGWDVVVVEKGGELHASLPFVRKRLYGFTVVGQPILTQHLGPWIKPMSGKYATELARQKDLYSELIAGLPRFDRYLQNWAPARDNWLPFYWQGFKQTTRYTYVLPDLSDESALWDGLQQNIRREIRKAAERFAIQVRTDLNIADFYALNRQVFERQGMPAPYSLEHLKRLDDACVRRECRRIFVAQDSEGRRHAAVYLVWDENSAYYLMGGGDPKLRSSGATSLCMWEAIRFAATVTKRFDFEGSMLEPVERFFRGFGAIQVPYFSISKTPSRLLSAALLLKQLKGPV